MAPSPAAATPKKAAPKAAPKPAPKVSPKQTTMSASPSVSSLEISEETRRAMISEAAYYIAAQRNFEGGDPCQDWQEAESQIDRMLLTQA